MDLRQIDVLVHQHVMEVDLTGFDWPTGFRDRMVRETRDGDGIRVEWIDIPRYSSDMGRTWHVFKTAMKQTFSIRWQFFDALERIVRARLGAEVAWPDLLRYIEPRDMCLAALEAYGVEVPEDA